MDKFIKSLNHPTFGTCEVVPKLVAIKLASSMSEKSVQSILSSYSLSVAGSGYKQDRTNDTVPVNNTDTLLWATASRVTAATLRSINKDENVEWVAPVYRAKASEKSEQSYFTIDPTVLILSEQADAAVDVVSIDSSAKVNQARTAVLRGFVVYNFPNSNAITVGLRLKEKKAIQGIENAINFENIPYLSPICCGCQSNQAKQDKCAPSIAAHLPNDTFFPDQWGLQKVNAPSAWSITKGNPNVVVAVLDQGVELAHPDLNVWPISYSTITHTNDGSPVGNHGTPCAGIISSRMDNALGAAGLAPECPVMAIATNFADTQVAEGLFFAADNGARVVSMSFGVYPSWMMWNFAIIEAALQYCHERNVVLVAATGNENQAISRFPGTDPRTLGIGGSNRDDERKRIGDSSSESWWGACYGPSLDVVAPCLEIPSTDRLGGSGYTTTDYTMTFNGTSSATPHVAALAGLILSVNNDLTNTDVYEIISQTTDKISPNNYVYLGTAGKPYGTWNDEVGYGRINVERALLVACESKSKSKDAGRCSVDTPEPEECCVSPCDTPWRPDENCIYWYEEKFLRVPLGKDQNFMVASRVPSIQFRVTYEHKICLLGKQHGPLLYTTTLLPGETLRLYHSDRYRQITSTQQRYSVQTTFMQFLSTVHQARVSGKLDILSQQLSSSKSGSSSGSGGGFFGGLFGFGGGSSESSSSSTTNFSSLAISVASEQFSQSVEQSSQLTHAERSISISTYEDSETKDITVRTLRNDNECRAVTYFVRQIMELYAMSSRISDISYRILAPNAPEDWRSIDDISWLPDSLQQQLKNMIKLLPKIGDIVQQPRPVSLPTDGVVYNPELANCCSCEPEREAAIRIRLEKEKAEALKACMEVQEIELELQRRKMLLASNDLNPFKLESAPEPLPNPVED